MLHKIIEQQFEYMEHENDRNKDKCLFCQQLKAFALGHAKLIIWFYF